MVRGGILALDLSSITGWARGIAEANAPSFGTWHLPVHLGWGAAFAAFENELDDAIEGWAVDEVVMEAPLAEAMKAVGEGFRNEQAAYQQFALAGLTEATCYRHAVPCSSAHVGTVRKHVLGNGRIPKDRAKAEVLRYCKFRGWDVPDHNAGDACVLWTYRASLVARNRRIAA
jgi:hypothetical protein